MVGLGLIGVSQAACLPELRIIIVILAAILPFDIFDEVFLYDNADQIVDGYAAFYILGIVSRYLPNRVEVAGPGRKLV